MTLTFYKPLRIVEVDLPDTSISMQNLINGIRDWEDDLENMEVYEIIAGAGKEELGGGVSVGITLTLKGWRVKFADRLGPEWVVCNLDGGNLTCVTGTDEEIRLMSGVVYTGAVAPAAYVTVTQTSSSSATFLEQEALQFSSYMNGVWVHNISGSSGTTYPIGTREEPVNNFSDAVSIAQIYGFNRFYIMATGYCHDHDISNIIIQGENCLISKVDISDTCITNATEIRNCVVSGHMSGLIRIEDCHVKDISNFHGVICNCLLDGTIELGDNGTAQFINCKDSYAGLGVPTIDMGGDGIGLSVRGYYGGLKIQNKTGAEDVSINFDSGRLILDSSVTSGDIIVRGVAEIVDNSVGTNVMLSGMINPGNIEERLTIGNRSVKFFDATGDIPSRNCASGEINYMRIRYKNDADVDWSSPRREQNMYYWYENLGDSEPIEIKEE